MTAPAALAPAIEAWATWLAAERRAADHTLAAYRRDLQAFLAFLGDHLGGSPTLGDLGELRPADFRAWLARRAGDGYARTSTARALSVVRGFLRFLDRRDIAHNPAARAVRAPKRPASVPKPLAIAEAADAIDASGENRTPWIAARDVALMTLLYGCGLRIGEALGLDRRAAPLGETMTNVGKGRKARRVPVQPAVRAAIDEYQRLL
ncbi:MAG: site-specific integrase, partial [Alphaproteobacteria bacterium]